MVLEERRRLRQHVRRNQEERAPAQGRGEGGIRTSGPSGAPLRASTSVLREPLAPAKITETINSLTPSCVTIVDLIIPQGIGEAYTPKTHRVTSQGLIGVEARKSRNCHGQEISREEDGSSRRPVPHQQEKANRRTAQDRAGQEAPRPGHWGRHPLRPTPPEANTPTQRGPPQQSGARGYRKGGHQDPENSRAGASRSGIF